MSYISTMLSQDKKKVLVWERNKKGKRKLKKYSAEYGFFIPDDDGEYRDIHDNPLMRVHASDFFEHRQLVKELRNRGIDTYESDVRPEHKVISNYYYGNPTHKLNITLYDIEVDYDKFKGFPDPYNPYAPISSIAIYHHYNGRMVVYAVPPPDQDKWKTVDDIAQDVRDSVELHICKNEKQLLQKIIEEFNDSDIISGWNSDYFDMPYVYERIKMVLGKSQALNLCLEGGGEPYYREVKGKFGSVRKVLVLKGRVSIDYLELYKNFEMEEKALYSLEFIADEVLPDLPKLEYDGTLYQLYREDFDHFLRYNARDTEVLKGFEEKLGYMQVAIDMAYMTGGQIKDVLGTIKIAEAALVNYSHNVLNKRVPDYREDDSFTGEKFTGALVLDPEVGMHDWISSIDIASLYPSAIRTVNISPDTIVGQFIEKHKAYEALQSESKTNLLFQYEDGTIQEMDAPDWKKLLKENGWTISGYGSVFDMANKGLIPSILEEWYNDRKRFKKRVSVAKDKILEIEAKGKLNSSEKKEIEELEQEASYCDRIQYIKKIQLNSMYGALGNQYFKFFDIRLAESTTRSGRAILMHMVRKTAELLDGKYTWPSDSTIYSDTDSVYFKTHAEDADFAKRVGKAIEKKVNKTFSSFVSDAFLCTGEYAKHIVAEQEIVSDKGIFIKKKHYILHLVNIDGYDVDKMKVMGMALKKTTVPKPIKVKLTEFVESLLKGENWKNIAKLLVNYRDEIKYADKVLEIGLPAAIRTFDKYVELYNTTNKIRGEGIKFTGAAAASIFWNYCLDKYDDKESIRIQEGMKIKIFYFNRMFGEFKGIAVPAEMTSLPEWFEEHFTQYIDREAQALRLINNTLKSTIEAIGEKMPTKKNLLFDELVEY